MKKNLLLFSSTFPRWPSDNEVPLFVFELGKELAKYFNVFALAPHAPGARKREMMEDIQVIRYPYFFPESSQALAYGSGILSNLKANRGVALQIPFLLLSQWRALNRAVRQHNIDIINSHWMIPQGWIASLLTRPDNVKHVLTVHAAGLFALRRLPMGMQMAKQIVANSDLIYCVSQYNRQVLKTLTGMETNTRVLPMGIYSHYYNGQADVAELRREWNLEQGKVILYVGKLNEKKGVTYLLQAFSQIHKNAPDTTLVIVGTGILIDHLKEESVELEIDSRVVFVGPQGKERVRNFYKVADVIAIPSIIDSTGETEGLPVVLLESLASGKPVVATRVGGSEDIIEDGINGFLVPPADPQSLAQKLQEVLASDAASLSEKAAHSVQPYDWENVGRDYAENISRLYSET